MGDGYLMNTQEPLLSPVQQLGTIELRSWNNHSKKSIWRNAILSFFLCILEFLFLWALKCANTSNWNLKISFISLTTSVKENKDKTILNHVKLLSFSSIEKLSCITKSCIILSESFTLEVDLDLWSTSCKTFVNK